ncbi:MAG: CBS domain-containing protein [Bacteroidales bacterium]|jgi:putative hemolysin|nr:CBS domain-containing protein [Bacteroidales bacterium]
MSLPFFKKLKRKLSVSDIDDVTEDEIRNMIKSASESGEMEEEQSFIHEKLFYFSDKKAKHVMTHRSEVKWIDINLPEAEFLQTLLDLKNSRIVVCNHHIDDYRGIIKVKEYLAAKILQGTVVLEELIYQPVIFSENTDAQDILNEFRKQQNYFGIVLDEFGTLAGIITLHNIMENIVGEIPEEEEVVEPDLTRLDDNSTLVNGEAPIEALLDVINNLEIDFEEIDYATVAGFVLDHLEKIPLAGDFFDYLGYKITIHTIVNNRIDKVLITKI